MARDNIVIITSSNSAIAYSVFTTLIFTLQRVWQASTDRAHGAGRLFHSSVGRVIALLRELLSMFISIKIVSWVEKYNEYLKGL